MYVYTYWIIMIVYMVWFYLYNILKRTKYRAKKDSSSYWDYKEVQGQGGYAKRDFLERCVMILVVVQEPKRDKISWTNASKPKNAYKN